MYIIYIPFMDRSSYVLYKQMDNYKLKNPLKFSLNIKEKRKIE